MVGVDDFTHCAQLLRIILIRSPCIPGAGIAMHTDGVYRSTYVIGSLDLAEKLVRTLSEAAHPYSCFGICLPDGICGRKNHLPQGVCRSFPVDVIGLIPQSP